MWQNAGYKIRKGEKPVLSLELWCPRERKNDAGESLSSSAENPPANSGLFFQFKKCSLYSREQMLTEAEFFEDLAEKEAAKLEKARKKELKAALMPTGIAPCRDYKDIPNWCKRLNGVPVDVAVLRVQEAGFYVEDGNSLYELLQAI